MKALLVALFLLFFSNTTGQSASSDPYEKQLIEQLSKRYNKRVRPIQNQSEPLNINVELYMESIKNVNEKDGTITISGWLDMTWTDFYLQWDPAKYGNISYVLYGAERIWKPDVEFNSVIGERVFRMEDAFIGLFNDGEINYAPGGVTTHSCELNMLLFPFDKQTCKFILATWFSSAKYIKLIPDRLTYGALMANDIWDIVNSTTESIVMPGESHIHIAFVLTIRRKPLYFIIYVIIPLLMLALLNVMVFRVPPNSSEKVSLSITILLAIAIWLTMLNDIMPRSSDSMPILGIFVTVLMLLSAVSTVAAVCVVRVYNYDPSFAIPSWAEYVVRVFPFEKNYSKKQELYTKSALSWNAVALALDQFTFIAVSLVTVLLIVACIVGFVVLEMGGFN